MKWFDVLPYAAEEEPGGIKALLDHAGRFVVLARLEDSGEIVITAAVRDSAVATVGMLDGMEAAPREPFGFGGYGVYARYFHKRHCAVPVADKESDVESVYGLLNREVKERAFLCLNVRKTASMSRVTNYIQALERGHEPEGLGGLISSMFSGGGKGTVSAAKQARIQAAKSKISRRTHLFSCEILCGAMTRADLRAIGSAFHHGAFTPRRIKEEEAPKLATRTPSPPFFGGDKHPLLSDMELASILDLPTADDLQTTSLRRGKTTSYTSGARITGMKSTVE